MFEQIQAILSLYRPVSLEEIETIKLMNRMDTKYILSIGKVQQLLMDMKDEYLVLEIASQRYGRYRSVYYDTPDLQMFHAHVTSRYPRFKVRERTYSQNGLQFLEVKHKSVNGRTSKKRLSLNTSDGTGPLAEQIIGSNTPFHRAELCPQLDNCFNRVTLVNKDMTERLTLDFNLQFNSVAGGHTPVFEQTVVVELKQDRRASSPVARRLRDENIRQSGMSKYCVGMLLLNEGLSYKMYKKNFNRFLQITQQLA